MNRLLLAPLLFSSLSACVTTEERRATQLKQDQQTCTAYGIKSGTPMFAECMMRLGEQRAVADMVYSQNAARMGAQLLNGEPAF